MTRLKACETLLELQQITWLAIVLSMLLAHFLGTCLIVYMFKDKLHLCIMLSKTKDNGAYINDE